MSDKIQLIKEEIEKELTVLDKTSVYDIGRESELNHLLLFIDSLPEEHNEDLEEAADAFYDNCNMPKSSWWDEGVLHKMSESKETFIAGAEWQKQQMKEILRTEYEKGRFDMREEMIKALVDGEVVKNLNNQLCVKSEPIKDTFGDLKFGDKVKTIIVKEEQQ